MSDTGIHDGVNDNGDVNRPNKSEPGEDKTISAPATQESQPSQKGPAHQSWLDRALTFVSQASNETLGACFVGLGASTYVVLGRFGLLIIGVFGGVALHATWERNSLGPSEGQAGERDAQKRRELGLEVVQRVLNWRDRTAKPDGAIAEGEQADIEVKLLQGKSLDFSDFEPETAAALDVFTTAVIRDYVKWWYSPQLPGEEAFPTASRQVLTAFLISFSAHLSKKRPAEIFLNFTINSSSVVVALLGELSLALNASPNSDAVSAIDTYLQMKPESSLAHMLDAQAQDKKLTLVAEDILQNFLEPKAYNLPVAHIFLRQILSKLILGMTLETCSKADWINGWIVYLLEEGEPDILHALDEGIEQSAKGSAKSATISPANKDKKDNVSASEHSRNKSKAEEAMEQAMEEARRLTLLIKEEEARRAQALAESVSSAGDASESVVIKTPTSSQSELERFTEAPVPDAAALADRPSTEAADPIQPTSEPNQAVDEEQQFVNFDQLGPAASMPEFEEDRPVLTLHNTKISIFDDSTPGEKTKMKSKPTVDYLIQIEPADSRLSGWMIARKYVDFEVLHEVLRRISVIAGVPFADNHPSLPSWKALDKPTFRIDLEQYLMDAVKFQQLAESEGMKRFLAKDQGLAKQPAKGLGWPDPLQMGKGMFDVLAKAPKEVAGGGKALFGNVTNVLNNVKRPSAAARTSSVASLGVPNGSPQPGRPSIDLISRHVVEAKARASTESFSSETNRSSQDIRTSAVTSPARSALARPSMDAETAMKSEVGSPDIMSPASIMSLPPPPSAIDSYDSPGGVSPMTMTIDHTIVDPSFPEAATIEQTVVDTTEQSQPPSKSSRSVKKQDPITEREANVIVDLMFAVISELYTLSSAWTFRRTLLQAARTFILRPGNPQLEAIRVLMQDSVIAATASDSGLAAMILKTRENSLPTEEELKLWPAPLKPEESEALRIKARKLLVERGMPVALTSVMGAAATGEALGKVFDCLQIQRVAKSLMFGLMLQALRAAVQ